MNKIIRSLIFIVLILVMVLNVNACGRIRSGAREAVSEETEYNNEKNERKSEDPAAIVNANPAAKESTG